MFHVVLYEPEIPPNTGNIIRLCANSGAYLHLIHPLGFSLSEPRLRRAGLDYHDLAHVSQHASLDVFLQNQTPARLFAVSTRGRQCYADVKFTPEDALLFGPEARGLPDAILNSLPGERVLRIPMRPGNRSLNLSNSVAIIVYEGWRQQNFAGKQCRFRHEPA